MNFKQLEYFTAVAEEKSISRAARKLHIAQPPVSRQIAMLEDELKVCLFLRTNKGVELTEAGESLYEQSRTLFQNLRTIAESVRDIDSGLQGVLKIGTIYSDVKFLMGTLRKFHKIYPKVEIYIRLGTPDDLLDDLTKGNLHVLFLRNSAKEKFGLQERILGEDPLELIMTPEMDPAPGKSSVPIMALKDVPMCMLRSDDVWRYSDHLIQLCQQNGFTPNTVCRCYDSPMAMQLVQAGVGVSYMPRSIVATLPGAGLVSKPIEGLNVKSYPILVWSDHLYYASCVKRFLAMFDEKDGEQNAERAKTEKAKTEKR